MARADFYLIAKPRFLGKPLALVCELVKKALASGQPTLVLARDRAQAEELDDLLWATGEDDYIPHQLAGAGDDGDDGGDEQEVEVLIAPPDADVPLRPLVINLREAAVDGAFERVLEVVPADPDARGPLRERWNAYKARGLAVHKHDM